MNTIGNILWFVFGGIIMGLSWCIAGLILCVTIIGIPAGKQCFKIAGLAFFPFGKKIRDDGDAGSLILNILWILLFGWELAVEAFGLGIVFCITIVGIPFGKQCFKLARLCLFPFGKTIVEE